MLLAAIDERHRGTYDFIYLPIDFKVRLYPLTLSRKEPDLEFNLNLWLYDETWSSYVLQNKCNVGYAFINMTDPRQIVPFYQVCFL